MLRSPLLHFVILGIAFFAVRAVWISAPAHAVIEIRQSEIDQSIADFERRNRRPADNDEARAIENQIVENRLWLEQAWALDLHEVDPVVRRRLIQNMRFLETGIDLPESEFVERAIELGLHKSDPVIQRRLVARVRDLITAGVRARSPDEARLRLHYQKNADRWRTPLRLDLSHVYLSRDRRGQATGSDATALLRVLVDEALLPEAGIRLGDPFLSGHRLSGATRARIVARLGPDFANRVATAPSRRWFGPVESAFGSHLVWIHERLESELPKFEEVRTRVLEDWFDAEARIALRDELERHRRRVEIRILEDASGPNS